MSLGILVRGESRMLMDDLQADQLDLSKTKATELLRAHDTDAVKAMTAWVTATV